MIEQRLNQFSIIIHKKRGWPWLRDGFLFLHFRARFYPGGDRGGSCPRRTG